MKKFIAILAAVSMIATPAIAEAKHRQSNYHRHDQHGGVSTGEAVAIGLGALIIGGAIANSNRQRERDRYEESRYEPRYEPQLVCKNEYVRDYYGNYILDQYGRAVFKQRCWYQ